MALTFVCKNCHQEKAKNLRLKTDQEYCSAVACQRARKKAWHQEKMAHDELYRQQQKDCLQQWRKQRPLHLYQKQYRLDHPAYVIKNRQQQRHRNRKRAVLSALFRIVKMDASTHCRTNNYLINPRKATSTKKIVKMDALLMQIIVLDKDVTAMPQAIVDREFDFAGGQKTEEIILCQTSDTQPFPHFQSAEPYPAPSPLLICRQITQSKSENQAKSL